MIHEVVPSILAELQEFFNNRFDSPEEMVVMGNMVNQDGSSSPEMENKLVVTLINIERDGSKQMKGDGFMQGNPPVHVNVYLMFAANFQTSNYAEALKFISGVMGFFQGHTVFTHHNAPLLPANAKPVKVEIVNLAFRELVNLWSIIGAKYVPSVLYRFRAIDMDIHNIQDEIPAVAGITV